MGSGLNRGISPREAESRLSRTLGPCCQEMAPFRPSGVLDFGIRGPSSSCSGPLLSAIACCPPARVCCPAHAEAGPFDASSAAMLAATRACVLAGLGVGPFALRTRSCGGGGLLSPLLPAGASASAPRAAAGPAAEVDPLGSGPGNVAGIAMPGCLLLATGCVLLVTGGLVELAAAGGNLLCSCLCTASWSR